jgi:hypothetical protein
VAGPQLEKEVLPKYRDRGVQAIGFVRKEEEEWARELARKHHISYPIVLDSDGKFSGRFTNWMPLQIILDREGRFQWGESGYAPDRVTGALDALLAGNEPPLYRMPPPVPKDFRIDRIRTTKDGHVFLWVQVLREDYQPIDPIIERKPGQVERCRETLSVWFKGRDGQVWWLAPVQPMVPGKDCTGQVRLVIKPSYVNTGDWGTHVPRLPDVTLRLKLPPPAYPSAPEVIAKELGKLQAFGLESKPGQKQFASEVRYQAASAAHRFWWRKGDRLRMAEAMERMLQESFFRETARNRLSSTHAEAGDAFAAAGDAARARKQYQLALDTAATDEERKTARERLQALENGPKEKWQAAARERTEPPEE